MPAPSHTFPHPFFMHPYFSDISTEYNGDRYHAVLSLGNSLGVFSRQLKPRLSNGCL